MGLFSRGSKSDVPLSGDEWSPNGHAEKRRERNDRTEIERPPAPPAEPERGPETQASEDPPAAPEPAAADPPEEAEAEPQPAEPPEEAKPEPQPVEAESKPPVNQPEPEEDDERRMSAKQALAPVRRPGVGKPPGAHIGDESERRARIISFANQKGGVAKTTTTLNLAVAFAESGHDVLAIDLDPQGNLTMSQGIDPDKVERSMYDVLVDHIPIRDVIEGREIDVAVASIDLAGAEIAMSMQIGRERSLEKALSAVVDDYDFVCIDTPPSLGLLTVNALTASDKVIVPVQCEYLSMRGLVQLQNTLEMIRENLNPRVQIEGILPTMLDSRTIHAKEAVEILEENFGELVFKSRIRKAIKFAEAPVRGSSVLKYDPQGNAAQYYRELAEEVLTNGAS
ncbi:MAG TPA: AAA family ATPase [Solirubrobacterales bacterium]|jgi:chromosome partitioning protein|nr:AAA family ATPase [Solirubrobacterales bacterium]